MRAIKRKAELDAQIDQHVLEWYRGQKTLAGTPAYMTYGAFVVHYLEKANEFGIDRNQLIGSLHRMVASGCLVECGSKSFCWLEIAPTIVWSPMAFSLPSGSRHGAARCLPDDARRR